MHGIKKMFNHAVHEYVSAPALCEFMLPNLDKTEDCGVHWKAMRHVWAIAAGDEHNLATKGVKLTR